jgi:hypothetical protein
MRTNVIRALTCDQALELYGDEDLPSVNLIDLLTDAMHWCDLNGESFEKLRRQAYQHYLAEIHHTNGRNL